MIKTGNEFKSIASQDGNCSVDVGEYAGEYKIRFRVDDIERGSINDQGLFEIDNISCRGLFKTVAFETDTISVVGGSVIVRPGDSLAEDMTSLDSSTLEISGSDTFLVGDFLRIKEGSDDEWLEVTGTGSAPVYNVTRDKAELYGVDDNPVWKKGAAVVNYGVSGKGGILLTSSMSHAPYISVFTHTGTPWTTLSEKIRVGNLNGFLEYASDTYGIGVGGSEVGEANLTFDPVNGIRIRQGVVDLFTIDMDNHAALGGVVVSNLQDGSSIGGQYIEDATITATQIGNAVIQGYNINNATISGSHIANGTIQGTNIENATIQGSTIASGTITGDNIDTATIRGTNIDTATIQGINIEEGTITGDNIDTATITGDKIYNGTIIGDKIDLATISGPHMIDGTILGRYIALATISGANLSQATIAGEHIEQGTITTGNIENATITGNDIDSGTIEGLNIASATITGGNIGTGEIGAVNIEDSSIIGGKIATATISGTHLVNQSITAGKIEDLTITASQIANLTIIGGSGGTIASGTISDYNIVANTITALQIAADTITASEIAAGAITVDEIAANTITTAEINTASVFVGMTIQSTAFNPGVTGWQINANGDVEFNDGTFRGATTWTGNTIGTSYTAAKCTDADADQTSANTAADITGQGDLATRDRTDLAYTDGADVTSASTANNTLNVGTCPATTVAGWRYGSTTYINGGDIYTNTITASKLKGNAFGTLTITSGKIAINTTDALEIQASGNINVLAGGDINMFGSTSNPSKLNFYDPSSALTAILYSYSNTDLYLMPNTDDTKNLIVGQPGTRWASVYITSADYTTILARTDISNYSIFGVYPTQCYMHVKVSGSNRYYYFTHTTLYPDPTNTIDLGNSSYIWRHVYAYTYKGPLVNNGAYIQCRSANNVSFEWASSQLKFYIDTTHVKTFVINHPTKTENYLVHGTLEGPEACVFYRGTGKLKEGYAEIILPDYFEGLTNKEGRTIILTMIDHFDKMMIEKQDGEKIKDGMFKVKSENPYSEQEFDWEVKAVRKDVGHLEVEPLKSKTNVKGQGPYTYI